MTIVLGAVLLYTGGIWITGLPQWWKDFGKWQLGSFKNFSGGTTGVSVQVIMLIILGLITHIMLKYTLIGRGIYAFGGSESSAIRVGYNIQKILLFIYIFCGMMTGIAAAAHISIVGQVDPNTYNGYELDVIAIVVLGGASTMGGYGTVLGTSLGIILMAILKNGLILAKVPTFWQKIVMGIIIVIAVSVDVINRKREQAKLVHVGIFTNGFFKSFKISFFLQFANYGFSNARIWINVFSYDDCSFNRRNKFINNYERFIIKYNCEFYSIFAIYPVEFYYWNYFRNNYYFNFFNTAWCI